jgi:inorganic pyrophosphatase
MLSSTEYKTEEFGHEGSDSYRLFFKKILLSSSITPAEIYISPFHDIQLYSEAGSNIYRMVVECPRWSTAKYEITKSEQFNPIRQNVFDGELKHVENLFPYRGFIWNYGCLPQTWVRR